MAWPRERRRHSQAAKKGHRNPRRKVSGIVDGDTFRVARSIQGNRYVRVAGLNAPEKGQKGYGQAKRKLARAIGGKTVSLKPVGKSYGRTVARITNRSPAIRKLKR